MNSIRLIPIVLMASIALLLFKGIGLMTNGGYVLVGSGQAQAQTASTGADGENGSGINDGQTLELTALEEEAAQRAANSLFEEGAQNGADQDVALPTIEDANGEMAPFSADANNPNTEEAILQRLSERRKELDARERALQLQEGLVLAAEARMQQRVESLQTIESRVQALIDKYNAQGDEQFSALVSMYANMKSADAAKVFNTLNMEILLRLATNMSPRKMSPILADMDVERAQVLTVRMATAQMTLDQLDEATPESDPTMNNLEQIVGQ